MNSASVPVGLFVGALLFVSAGKAQSPARPPVAEIPGDRLEFALGDPLSARALLTKPLPITGVLSWSLETRRHRGAIWCFALSPDGRTLATGGLDGTVRLWNVETGRLVHALIGHDSYVSSLDWSPDGNTLASAGTYDITVRLWDTRTGRPLRVLRGHPAETTLVRWSPTGRKVAAAGGISGALSCWFAASGFKINTVELGQPIPGVTWHPDGNSLVAVGAKLPLHIWDPDKKKVSGQIGTVQDGFLCAAWNPDGKTIAAGTPKETMVFDGASGKIVQTLAASSNQLTWIKEGKQLATFTPDSIKVWDAGKLLTTIAIGSASWFGAAPDAAHFITATGSSFAVYEGATGKSTKRFDNLSGTEPPLWWASKTLVTGIGSTKLSLWDPATGKRFHVLEGHTAAISAVAVAPGGKLLATASHDKTVRLWELPTGKLMQTFKDHAAAVLAVSFAGDGKTIASAGADQNVLVWDAPSAKLLRTLTGTTNVTALAWKPGDPTTLLTNSDKGLLQIWNARAGKLEKTLKGAYEMPALAWAPDGTRVAGGESNGDVLIWQESSAKLIHTLKEPGGPPHVTSLAWSPKGQALASGRGNHTMQLWEPKFGKKLHTLATMAPVARVSWTPGGTTVAVSNHERTTRFFDAATGKLRGLLLAEEDQVMAVGFDGHYRAPAAESELVYVILTKSSQDTYTPSQFAAKYKLKNAPAKVILAGN